MTEYTVTSQHIRDYKSSKERTSDWISGLATGEFYSPSVPHSEISDDNGISDQSDVESSHSVPPKLMLRWGDGRRDVPIPHIHDNSPSSPTSSSVLRSQTFPHASRSRGREQRDGLISGSPEEIRILPSQSQPGAGTRNASHHSRSKSLPRNAFNPVQNHDAMPVPHLSLPPSQIISQPAHPGGFIPQQSPRGSGHRPAFSQSQWPAYSTGHQSGRNPPSIVYAPSHARQPHYHPPAMYAYPPKIGPNGIIYSHSAPVPGTQYPPPGAIPYPAALPPSGRSRSKSLKRNQSYRTRSPSSPISGDVNASTPSLSSGSTRSGASGSTYYVIPNARQKVHVVRPERPEMSFYTATSTKKSPTTPVSPGSLNKKPFFQRLFHFAERFSSAGSSKASGSQNGSRRIHRRHSAEHL
ncbi:hypothetical protein C8J56DRAFT_348639 [Mycena floridula]|nr:hypothetical protein C8J56DRAFT_348639 [Mycena floridula]